MVNPTGRNQWYNGKEPPEDELIKELHQYAKERLPLESRLKRLKKKFEYKIELTKLKALNKKYNIPSVRKPPPYEVSTSIVCEKAGSDLHRRNGPYDVVQKLAVDGVHIPRDTVRKIMRENDPIGFQVRNPQKRNQGIIRVPLTSPGRMYEINCDGHEKFGPLALRMGGVGFDIYGMREKASGTIRLLVTVPNARYDVAIGHVYLDYVEANGELACQMTCDGGNETGYLQALHVALRRAFAPDLDETVHKPFVAVKSVHNVVIENIWARWTKSDGENLRTIITEGQMNGLFDHTNPIHVNLFQWLWPKITQVVLDRFREYWNCHRVRGQRKKLMPSGSSPNDIYLNPEAYGLEDFGIRVADLALVNHLRSELPVSREEALRFVDDEFNAAAQEAYAEIGSPALDAVTGWDTFSRMGVVLQRMYDDREVAE